LSVDRLAQLFDLWPAIMILIGLELIIRRSMQGRSADIAAALIVLIAVAGAVVYVAVAPPSATNQTMDSSDTVGNLDHVGLEIDAGAATITMAGSDSLAGQLYHAHVEYSGVKPEVSLDRSTSRLRIEQSTNGVAFFENRHLVVTLDLNPKVRWTIMSNTGAASETMRLSGVNVGSVEINTGASREDITLGPPSGIVPITVNGGALTVNVHRPSGAAASVAVSGGAVNLDADGRQSHAIGSLSFETSNFGAASDGYRVEVNGGACSVTIDTGPATG
ncbi:MAG: hypothetical protein ACREOM_11350, partial [Candidatus Dormibacteraceae bacterium]